jgi:hypothetical protein
MTFTVAESPWVTLRRGDPSFQLQGPYTMATRASIEITKDCPREYALIITQAHDRGWLKAVATVPKDDPTYMWETLKR